MSIDLKFRRVVVKFLGASGWGATKLARTAGYRRSAIVKRALTGDRPMSARMARRLASAMERLTA